MVKTTERKKKRYDSDLCWINDEIEVINGNFRESYLEDMRYNHDTYKIPYNLCWFEDDYGYKLPMNHEVKTKANAKKYFKKLCSTLGKDYKLQYYEIETDDDLKDISFKSDIEIEKIIRLIVLEDDSKFKNKNLQLGVITIDLTDIVGPNGKQVYKGYFEKVKKVLKEEWVMPYLELSQ